MNTVNTRSRCSAFTISNQSKDSGPMPQMSVAEMSLVYVPTTRAEVGKYSLIASNRSFPAVNGGGLRQLPRSAAGGRDSPQRLRPHLVVDEHAGGRDTLPDIVWQ